MYRRLIIAAFIAAAWLAAHVPAEAWKLVASFPTPGPDPRGYSVTSGVGGFIVIGSQTPYVFKMRWSPWIIISSFPAPGGPGAWGMAGYSLDLYLSNNRTSWIYKMNEYGSVVSSFRCPVDGPADMDIRWSPLRLYIAIPARNIIAVVNQNTGSLESTFAAPGSRPTACGGYTSFYVTDAATHTVYRNGSPIITDIETPVGFSCTVMVGDAPQAEIGLCIVDDATDRIYFYANDTAVAPASLGKVKALFE